MTPTVQLFFPHKAARIALLAATAITAAALLVLLASRQAARKNAALPLPPNQPHSVWQSPALIPPGIFIPENTGMRGTLANRFRLAGTVIDASDDDDTDDTLAIIDDRTAVRQTIARVGNEIAPGVTLVKISASSIILSSPDGDEEIFMERTASATKAPPRSPALSDSAETPGDFTKRLGGTEVFPGRWRFERDKVLEYYSELRDEPERLLTIFDTMDPVWIPLGDDGDLAIDGYVVNIKGEADFFAAAGLREGDIVKAVNNTHMSNRRRAENFITKFIQGETDTFVLEIERDGKIEKQAYVID